MAKLILTVDHAVMQDPRLDLLDKLILSYVINWEEKNKACFAKDGFFAALFGVTENEVRFSQHKLEALKIIDQITGTGGRLIKSVRQEIPTTPDLIKDVFEI